VLATKEVTSSNLGKCIPPLGSLFLEYYHEGNLMPGVLALRPYRLCRRRRRRRRRRDLNASSNNYDSELIVGFTYRARPNEDADGIDRGALVACRRTETIRFDANVST
jgi:hypothetical protein